LAVTALAFWLAVTSARQERFFESVPLVLLAMALSISVGLDFVRIEGDISRMNTLFKYYLEIWVLFSIASAYMVWRLVWEDSPAKDRTPPGGFVTRLVSGRSKLAWQGALLLLIACSLIYTVMGTKTRLADRFNAGPWTLDGAAYMADAVHSEKDQTLPLGQDLEAIRWLQDNVEGSPVVLEAHGDQYHWNARIANYTGLPTVLGWPWHQIQQRLGYRDEIPRRASHVAEIYNTTDVERAQELMWRYDISYVVLGELERIYYQDPGLRKFPIMAEQGLLREVYSGGGVVIYHTTW